MRLNRNRTTRAEFPTSLSPGAGREGRREMAGAR
jgi:hypothetical protein